MSSASPPLTIDVKSHPTIRSWVHHSPLHHSAPLSFCCCWEEAGCIAWKQKVGVWRRTRGGLELQERCEGHMKWPGGPDLARGPCVWHLWCRRTRRAPLHRWSWVLHQWLCWVKLMSELWKHHHVGDQPSTAQGTHSKIQGNQWDLTVQMKRTHCSRCNCYAHWKTHLSASPGSPQCQIVKIRNGCTSRGLQVVKVDAFHWLLVKYISVLWNASILTTAGVLWCHFGYFHITINFSRTPRAAVSYFGDLTVPWLKKDGLRRNLWKPNRI